MTMIIRTKFGSHLYGTNTINSDFDFKSVFIPIAKQILLQRAPESVNNQRPKQDHEKNVAGEIDEESFSLHKYLKLLAEGQTVSLDILFAPPEMWLVNPHPVWREIYDNRSKLITKQSASFVGYCRTQANKYGIKGSRIHAARSMVELLTGLIDEHGTREKLGRFHNELTLGILGLEHTSIFNMRQQSGVEIMHLECCNRKAPYTICLKDARDMFKRTLDEYGGRALQAEKDENIDWKALSHAVRVGEEALELLATGFITFPLVNAEHIIEIKTGQLPYRKVAEEIEGLLIKVEEAVEKSILQEKPDMDYLENLICEVYKEEINKGE